MADPRASEDPDNQPTTCQRCQLALRLYQEGPHPPIQLSHSTLPWWRLQYNCLGNAALRLISPTQQPQEENQWNPLQRRSVLQSRVRGSRRQNRRRPQPLSRQQQPANTPRRLIRRPRALEAPRVENSQREQPTVRPVQDPLTSRSPLQATSPPHLSTPTPHVMISRVHDLLVQINHYLSGLVTILIVDTYPPTLLTPSEVDPRLVDQ